MNEQLLTAVARAEYAARLAYQFTPGGYVADFISAVASVRAAIDAPDWITAYLEYLGHAR